MSCIGEGINIGEGIDGDKKKKKTLRTFRADAHAAHRMVHALDNITAPTLRMTDRSERRQTKSQKGSGR